MERVQKLVQRGRWNGTIRHVETVMWAYWLDARQATAWLEGIVNGCCSEADALQQMGPLPPRASESLEDGALH